jgi:hypothetical protein
MSDQEDNREQGVEFGSLADDLDAHEYPVSNEEVVEAFGDRELGVPDGTTSVRATLEPFGETTYESADEVERAILNGVGDTAIGRKNYTDREDPSGENTSESF